MFHPEDQERAWAIWQHSLATGEPYHIEYRLRHRSGEYHWVIGRAQCVRDASGAIARWYGTCTDIHDIKIAEQRLREESRTLETLNRTGAALAGELDLERVVQMVTDAGVELTGAKFGAYFHNVYDEAGERLALFTLSGAGRSAFEALGRPRATAIFAPTLRSEGVIRSDDIMRDPRYGRHDRGGMPLGHVPVRSYLGVPVVSRSGEVLGALLFGHPEPGRFTERHERLVTGIAAQAAIAIDNAWLYRAAQAELEERRRGEAHRQLLVNELNHRVKNTLAIVQGIAQQSFRQDKVSPEARRAFEGRLAALATAHNLLTRENWEAASLRQVVEDAMRVHLGPGQRRVSIDGPDMRIAPEAAVSIAMALHELATNATKYGALSTEAGCVRLRWQVEASEAGDRLHPMV